MAFEAATIQYLEDALSEAFKYHAKLDAFLKRSGVSPALLAEVREKAEVRSAGRFDKAPKRFVAQIALEELASLGDEGDRIIAAMVTGLTQMTLPDATEKAKSAIEALQSKIKTDREIKAENRAEAERAAADARRAGERAKEAARAARTNRRDGLRDRFLGLMEEANVHGRGYLFETFLNDLFELEELDPRRSFRNVGEQIDGSFVWRGRANLVEAKWTKAPVAGAEFSSLIFKLDGKTADTRGLFVSVNGYSADAIKALNGKGALKFVCLDGSHLMRALMSEEGLVPVLERIWRHADETGEAYLPASKL
jgi:hypothetical protein